MSDTIEITQKSAPASNTTQIAVQYNGMTPEQASKQTIDLFMENFPKLQSIAKEVAEKRVTELCDELFKKLEDKQVYDYKPFADPDVQYVLYEAQKNYARFGEKETMDILTDLIVNRIQNDNTKRFKRAIDNAILIASELSSIQLDCLSAQFVLTSVKFLHIKSITDLSNFFKEISSNFNLKSITFGREVSFLNFKGCLQIAIPDISEIQSKHYSFPKSEVDAIMPDDIRQFSHDYGISEIGIVIAIINAEKKSRYKFNLHNWITD